MIAINVRADWEGLGTMIFALLVVLFFGFGVWRNIARRRKARTAPETTDAVTATDAATDETADAAGTAAEAETNGPNSPAIELTEPTSESPIESSTDVEPAKTVTGPEGEPRE